MRPDEFESHVRRVSKLKWPGATGGSEIIAGTQIDGVFRCKDQTYLVEATIERAMEKVRADINKLVAARREEEKAAFVVECWMVMLGDPTADQRQLARSSRVMLVSVEEFAEPVLITHEYLYLRPRHTFGSVADPAGKRPSDEIMRYPTPISLRASKKDVTIDFLVQQLITGSIVVLLGDFGAGKSITTRDIYRRLEAQTEATMGVFPICVNLREHWGQETADELFIRHAQRIGSKNGLQLYRAWKEGFVLCLLDGFDEVAPQPWAYDRSTLTAIRKRALAAVRNIVELKPRNTGLLIAGRTHYFPSEEELCEALGIRADRVLMAELRELADEEVVEFLSQYKLKGPVSVWLPRRPLLLSYLAETGYLTELAGVATDEDVGRAWVQVIEMVCEREAKIAPAMRKQTVADVLCRLAHLMRARSQQLGPISDTDLEEAFRMVTKHQPNQDAWAILQRLPGVTFHGEGEKWFVDEEWADALAGISVARMIIGTAPNADKVGSLQRGLGSLGVIVGVSELLSADVGAKDVVAWVHDASRCSTDPTVIADAVTIAGSMARSPLTFHGITIEDAHIDTFDPEDCEVSGLSFSGCWFNRVSITGTSPARVLIRNSAIEVLDGVASAKDLPAWIVGADVGTFRFPKSNAEVLDLNLPNGVKVGIVVLRRVFVQAGSRREFSALTRGMDSSGIAIVRRVLRVLEHEGYVVGRRDRAGHEVIHRVRARASEVKEMLSSTPDLRNPPWVELGRL